MADRYASLRRAVEGFEKMPWDDAPPSGFHLDQALRDAATPEVIGGLLGERDALLKALQRLVDRDLGYVSGFVDKGLIRIQDVQAARNAIAKATGAAA